MAILSESMARRFFAGRDPVGMRLKQSGPGVGDNWMEIVGVVGDVKYVGLDKDTDAAYYMPFAQSYTPRMFLVVRTAGDAAAIGQALRRDVAGRRSGSDARPGEHDAAGARVFARPAAFRHPVAGGIRRPRTGVGGRRDLRRRRVLGGAADARNRGADGARGGPRGRLEDGASPGRRGWP